MRAPLWFLALALSAHAYADDDGLTKDQRAALRELDAKIVQLKAAGKLPDALPAGSATATTTVSTLATQPAGCTRLAPGESAVIDYADAGGPTGVSARYGLSRPKENTFVAELNLEFTRGTGFEGDLTPSQINNQYKGIVSACLKEYEGALKNERSSRALVVRLAANPAIPVQTIRVVAKGKRPNALEYPSDIGCPAILHELMHLLGLVDEYRDTPGLHEPMADCRPTGADDSLMSHHDDAVRSLQPRTAYAVEMCRCSVKGDACWALAEKNKGDRCPPGTTSFLKDIPPDTKTSFNVFNSSEAFALNEKKVPSGTTTAAAHTSVLYPAHFRAITEPGCRDVNENYYGCVANAYRSSKKADGKLDEGCLPKPEACKWNSLKWLQ